MNVVTTNRANCKDCYKCVRSCPVKAIKIVEGHAQVVDEKCIQDGMCVKICPQGAKEVRSDLGVARGLIASGAQVMASLAPSFVAAFTDTVPGRVVAALRRIGFSKVQETAVGAELVARVQRRVEGMSPRPVISSSCPTVVNLVKRYFPGAIPYLSPIVSPMMAHARMARRYWGSELKVVFIGPCIAKKGEMEWDRSGDGVDAVLTFEELLRWFEEEGLVLQELPPEGFDNFGRWDGNGGSSSGFSRLFPVEGGFLKTAGLSTDSLGEETLVISGIESCMKFLRELVNDETREGGTGDDLRVVEMLGCVDGCINGPAFPWEGDPFTRRRRVLRYGMAEREGIVIPHIFIDEMERQVRAREEGRPPAEDDWLFQKYPDEYVPSPLPDESEIRRILAATGKFTPDDELNCGACGYNSCREKAIAVYQGMAEVEMCIPYMRARAESLSTLILESIPNGIIVTNRELEILEINSSAGQMFKWNGEMVKGRCLSELMDSELFARVVAEGTPQAGKCTYEDGRLVMMELVVPVPKQGLIIGIFTDITREERQREELARVKIETLEKAQQVIDKQMRVAQEIAGLLGETTAETKVLLTKLIKLMRAEEG